MSDLSVASTVSAPQQSTWAQRKSLFDQLGQDLQKGDLKAAQADFAALQANAPKGAQGGQANTTQNPLAALADALQKGDLAGAQQAFSQLQQTKGHHHHHRRAAQESSNSSTTAATTTEQSQWAQRNSLFEQLGQALQKGDLKAAQTAFAALQANAPQGPPPPQSGQATAAQNPFTALADALQKGDLTAAQQAFSQIQQARGHHHHHAAQASSSAATTSSAATGSSTSRDSDGDHDGSTGTKVDVTA